MYNGIKIASANKVPDVEAKDTMEEKLSFMVLVKLLFPIPSSCFLMPNCDSSDRVELRTI